MNDWLLTLLVFWPTVGAVMLALVPRQQVDGIRRAAFAFSLGPFLLSLVVLARFEPNDAKFQMVQRLGWIPEWGASYQLGVDGVSLFLVLLTTFLTPLVVLAGWGDVHKRVKEYFAFLLVLETGMLGTLLATDMLLFYVFWEIMLVPMYFLIGVWGGPRRIYAAIKFVLFTMVGSLLMLVAIVWLAWRTKGHMSFAYADFLNLQLSYTEQLWLFAAFGLAFAIKVPLFPFHTWLPDAHVEAPTGGSVILAGVLLKMGTYGFLRFAIPLFPEAAVAAAPCIGVLAVIGIVYGALVATVQPDLKKLVAYSSVSHLGFVMLGLFAFTPLGVTGSLYQMLNHGLSTGALFLLVGMIYERRHTRQIDAFGGLWAQMPVYAVCFLIAMLASVGLPGLNGFVGEFLILAGAYARFPVLTAIATSGVVLGALYLLWMYQRVIFGPLTDPENRKLRDMSTRELVVLVPVLAMCFVMGLFPEPFLSRMRPSLARMIERPRHVAAMPAPASRPDAVVAEVR